MQSPNLSLIIPVFNAEKYLAVLLDSILLEVKNQGNVEILLLNDGSTDQSSVIVATYAIKYPFIKDFHFSNQGVSKTRNFGLSHAKGEYIWFIDSDDAILPNALETVFECINTNAIFDIITFGYQIEDFDGGIIEKKSPLLNTTSKGLDYLQHNDGRLYLWNNIYKMSFLKQNHLAFLDSLHILEDSFFNMQAFTFAEHVHSLDKVLYVYKFNSNSITKTNSLENKLKEGESSIIVHLETLRFCDQLQKNEEAFSIVRNKLAHSILGFFFSLLKDGYSLDYIKNIFELYSNRQLLPVYRENNTFKIALFQWFVNAKYPFLLLVKFFRTFNLFIR